MSTIAAPPSGTDDHVGAGEGEGQVATPQAEEAPSEPRQQEGEGGSENAQAPADMEQDTPSSQPETTPTDSETTPTESETLPTTGVQQEDPTDQTPIEVAKEPPPQATMETGDSEKAENLDSAMDTN